MTVADLHAVLGRHAGGDDVVVAGGGRLALVTRAAAEDGRRVVVLYVEGVDGMADEVSETPAPVPALPADVRVAEADAAVVQPSLLGAWAPE